MILLLLSLISSLAMANNENIEYSYCLRDNDQILREKVYNLNSEEIKEESEKACTGYLSNELKEDKVDCEEEELKSCLNEQK